MHLCGLRVFLSGFRFAENAPAIERLFPFRLVQVDPITDKMHAEGERPRDGIGGIENILCREGRKYGQNPEHAEDADAHD